MTQLNSHDWSQTHLGRPRVITGTLPGAKLNPWVTKPVDAMEKKAAMILILAKMDFETWEQKSEEVPHIHK
jgi:hypothetical protein